MTTNIKPFFKKATNWLDIHLLLLWLLTIPAASPLFQPTLARSADGLLHLYRVVALEQALAQGGPLFPRWLPDLAYGYGFPLFVFYAPLSYYITLILSSIGLATVSALNLSFILALFVAGTGVYLFVKDLFGSGAGMLAGMAYVYAPFQLLNTLSRGGLPAAWAMALFPFVFWIFARLLKQEKTLPIVPLAALILGAALLTHNTLSLLFVPLFALFLIVELGFLYRRLSKKIWIQTLVRVGLGVFLGVGLAAFFLIPAVLEKDFAQVERVIISPDFDFRFNFVTLGELFSLPQPANTGLLNPDFPLTLGLVQVALVFIGLISLIIRIVKPSFSPAPQPPRSPISLLIFTVTSLAIAIFMMLPISLPVWEQIPLLAFVQFPHRLLGPAAFILAILAGAAVQTFPVQTSEVSEANLAQKAPSSSPTQPVKNYSQDLRGLLSWNFALTAIGIILIFIASVPLLYPRYYESLSAQPTILDMMAYEHASGTIGTTSFGEYLPVWVEQVPRESPLEPMYQTKSTIERLDSTYLPAGATVESATYRFNQADVVINAPEPHQAIFHTFYFPGWSAAVDGQPASIAPVTERGLIGVSLPAGRHEVQLEFRETALRRGANLVSLVVFVGVVVMLIACCVLRVPLIAARCALRTTQSSTINLPQILTFATIAFVLIFSKTFYLDHFNTPLKQTFDGTTVPAADVSKQVNFGDQINLLGYDLSQAMVVSGDNFGLTLYWQARQPLSTNYSALAQLVDAENHLYAGQDNLHPGAFQTTLWQPWGFVQDRHVIPIPPGTPPGDYFLVAGLYDSTTWLRLPVVAGGDAGWPDVIAIPVEVTKPDHPPSIDELGIRWPIAQTPKVSKTFEVLPIRLLGATPERETIIRNDFLRLALFWEAIETPTIDYQISLRLVSADGAVAAQQTDQPSYNRYPTTHWSKGDRIRDNHALWIPPDFPAGEYRVQTHLLDETGQAIGDWVELGVLATSE